MALFTVFYVLILAWMLESHGEHLNDYIDLPRHPETIFLVLGIVFAAIFTKKFVLGVTKSFKS